LPSYEITPVPSLSEKNNFNLSLPVGQGGKEPEGSGAEQKSFQSLEIPFQFNPFFVPGLYWIINKQNQKRYIGEASNLADRLSGHRIQLQNNKHDCKELQDDWNTLGAENAVLILLL
jgi:hypothetical protein